jgi:formyltetrahydrofolate hydrolase
MEMPDPPADKHAVTGDDWSQGLIVLVRSPDRAGIVASLAASIQAAGGNIVELDQHTDVVEGDFGCRVEVAGGVDAQALARRLDELRSLLRGGAVFVDTSLPERPHRAKRHRTVGLRHCRPGQ